MTETTLSQSISAFRVLGLLVNASEAEIVARERELTGKHPADAETYRRAREFLLTRVRDRLRHELMEIPGASYVASDWDGFCRRFKSNPVGLTRFVQVSDLPTAADFEWKSLLHLAIEERISAANSDLTPAIRQSPFSPGCGPTPLDVYDVIFS